MAQDGSQKGLPSPSRLVPPIIWGTFSWVFLAALSQFFSGSFYLMVRGSGTLQYPSAIIVTGRSADPIILAVLGALLLASHLVYAGSKAGPKGTSTLSFAIMALSLYGYLFLSDLFLLLVGVAAFVIIVQDLQITRSDMAGRPSGQLQILCLTLAGVIAAVTVISVGWWVAAGVDGTPLFSGLGWGFALAGLEVLALGNIWLPWVVLLFLFSWALRPLLTRWFRLPTWRRDDPSEVTEKAASHEEASSKTRLFLPVAIALAAFVGAYPYLPAVNPAHLIVGTDTTGGYSCWLGLTPNPLLTWECNPQWYIPHIGTLWFLQGMTALTGSAKLTLELYPALAGILFVMSTYLLAKEGTGDSLLAGISALFAAVSLQASTAIDAGVLANWLALSVGFLFFAAFLRALRTKSFRLLFPASTITVTILFIHPWTWFLLLGILIAYLLVELVQARLSHTLLQRKIEVTMLSIKIMLGLIAGEAKSLLTLGTGSAPIITNSTSPILVSGFAPGVTTVLSSLQFANILQTVPFLASSMTQWVGGSEVNPLWFILGAMGVLAIPTVKGRFGKLLVVWVAAIGLSLLVTGSPDSYLQERLIFDIPIPILAAIGFTRGVAFVTARIPNGSLSLKKPSGAFWLLSLVAVTCLSLGFTLEYVGYLFIP